MEEKINELLSKNNFSEIKKVLKDCNPYDIADLLNDLDLKNMILVFRLLPKTLASDVFHI